MEEDDDHEDENAVFEDEGLNVEIESDTPPHLRELAAAAVQLGDVDALRRAIGFRLPFPLLFFHFSLLVSLIIDRVRIRTVPTNNCYLPL